MSYIQNLAADVYAWTFLVMMGLFGGFFAWIILFAIYDTVRRK